ncbi:probably inactive leucine-rich repeat receptor-like protein kinase [Tanacetum coccineum]|uniref:Probably inactive leucine-rich repeat receptor-like protein kinase n=1 Tax=Tanacetum coccineum TaxID=301880 RepID=A0ABQ5CDS9_9ASTR
MGIVDISSLMKCTSVIRQMAYGSVPGFLDEYLQMGETTTRKFLQMFCKAIMKLYGEEFLRNPTYTDMEKLYAHHEEKHGGYYLTNGMYPQWSILIKSIKNPDANDHKRIRYKTKHEAAREDV